MGRGRGAWAGGRAGLGLLALAIAVYLPGLFSIPPIDRDESRFAQASRQMLESVALPAAQQDPALHSGGLVVPMVQSKARLNKPPLVYWLQAASAWVFSGGEPRKDAVWMYRAPGVLCAIASVLMTWRLGLRMFDARAAWLAAALLAVCPLVVLDAHQARADQLLLVTVVGAQSSLWRVWRGAGVGGAGAGRGVRDTTAAPQSRRAVAPEGSGSHWLIFWLWLALGVLAKGPIAPMIGALTCVALGATSGSFSFLRSLRPLLGLMIAAAIVAPWVIAVGQRVGWHSYLSVIIDETLGRSLEPREGHWGPPGYHTVLLPVLFWPGSLLTLAGIGRAIARGFPARDRARRWPRWLRRAPGRGAEFFCLAWIVPSWIVFELVGTKLPHYTMPMYPAIALLSARAVLGAGPLRLTGSRRVATLVPWLVIGAALSVGVPLAPWFIGVRPSPWTIPLGVLWIVAIVVSAALLFRRAKSTGAVPWVSTQWAGIAVMAATLVFLLQGLLPWTKRLWPSARVMELLSTIDPGMSRPIGAVGYTEDSLVFLTRGRLARLEPGRVDAWLDEHPGGLAIVPSSLESGPVPRRVLGDLWGWNYSTGKRVDLLIVARAP